MDLNKIKTIDGLTESQFEGEAGRAKGVMVLATGTNNTGQTATDEDIGRIEITYMDQPIINRSFNHFVDIDDIREGTSVFNSTEAGDVEASCFIPFYEKGHPNALNIQSSDELNIRFIPADDGTVFDNLEIEFQLGYVSLPQRYVYKINGNDISENSARTSQGYLLNQRNTTALYVEDVDDIIDLIAFESNDRNVITPNSYLALQALTNYDNRIEDPSFSVIEIENHTPGVPGSTVNRNNKLVLTTSGAGDVDVTVCSMVWPEN